MNEKAPIPGHVLDLLFSAYVHLLEAKLAPHKRQEIVDLLREHKYLT